MKLDSLDSIVSGVMAFMPDGLMAEISLDEDGNVIVKYIDDSIDTYTQDEFGNIIKDGIEVFNEPSQMVLENADKIEKSDKLVKASRLSKDTEDRQLATSLLDRLNLGVNDDKELEKFIKKIDKEDKNENHEKHDSILELAMQQMPPEEIDHWQSDLYLKKTPVSDKLVADYEWKNQVTVFRDNIDNELWYEIPFAYGYRVRESFSNCTDYKKLTEKLNSALSPFEDGDIAYEVVLVKIADGVWEIYDSSIETSLEKAQQVARDYIVTKKDDEDLWIATIEEGKTYWGASADEFGSGEYLLGISNKGKDVTDKLLGNESQKFDKLEFLGLLK